MGRVSAAVLLFACTHAALGAWQTTSRDSDGVATAYPVAFTTNERGHRAEIFKDHEERVYLRFIRKQELLSFASNNCPTFQIDQRKPIHYFELGDRCTIEDKEVTVFLGRIHDAQITSLVLHRLMNGSQVAFRYTTKDGRYRESRFKLTNSKQVLKSALGFNTRILPK